MAKVLGLTAERAVGTFPTIVPGVQNGKYDVGLANLGVTAERSKVDVEFGPTVSLRYDASKIPGIKFLGQLTSTPIGLMTAKGSPLAPLLRDALDTLIRNGTYGNIVAKWDVKSSAISRSQLNPTPNL